MTEVRTNRDGIFSDARDFLALDGNAVMILTPQAAESACNELASLGRRVLRVEGGIWSDAGFEARIDCIWDAPDSCANNIEGLASLAIDFIRETMGDHNAYVVTHDVKEMRDH